MQLCPDVAPTGAAGPSSGIRPGYELLELGGRELRPSNGVRELSRQPSERHYRNGGVLEFSPPAVQDLLSVMFGVLEDTASQSLDAH